MGDNKPRRWVCDICGAPVQITEAQYQTLRDEWRELGSTVEAEVYCKDCNPDDGAGEAECS